MPQNRTIFFISDGTGITAEALGTSLLTRFKDMTFERETLPFIDSVDKAKAVVARINEVAAEAEGKPIVVDTIVDDEIRHEISKSDAFMLDVFKAFLDPLEKELGKSSSDEVGRNKISQISRYDRRIDAVNYALDNDDGARTQRYNEADVILIGVSRSGKTPACLYLALQYGILAANYPITEDDLEDQRLPQALRVHRSKLFGLSIEADRLSTIRNERKPNSRYASLKQCAMEVEEVELMYRRERIPSMNTTDYSVEEIATRILVDANIKRRF